MNRAHDPVAPFLEKQGFLVLDGGLATTLEDAGHDLRDELWSAKVLVEDPEAIRAVHTDFLAAGADCIATASYQATRAGFRRRGLNDRLATELLRRSVQLAVQARDRFWSDEGGVHAQRLRPLVAASVGPYGAFLANGAEYTGDYDLDQSELRAFHEERWRILAESPADLLACETIPSQPEAQVLLDLLRDTPGRFAWISFSCRDGRHLSDGSELSAVASACDAAPRLAAVGVNCTSPDSIPSLIGELRKGTDKPILVYPNLGEDYDPEKKVWAGAVSVGDFAEAVEEWTGLGAAGVGGCCRVGPAEIAQIRRRLTTQSPGGDTTAAKNPPLA